MALRPREAEVTYEDFVHLLHDARTSREIGTTIKKNYKKVTNPDC